ncbi:histidine ammonia-lyase-like [Arapaima gigas]
MPRVTVCVRGERLVVPCRDPSWTLQQLGLEALQRYTKHWPTRRTPFPQNVCFTLKRCYDQQPLDPQSVAGVVLENNDVVDLVKPLMFADVCLQYMALDGNSLMPADLVALGKGHYNIKLTQEAEKKINQAKELIDNIIKEKRVVYGINTGFGKFARVVVPPTKIRELQENVVLSSAAGVGSPLSLQRTRMLLALRINVLAKGHSGVSMDTLRKMIDAFNGNNEHTMRSLPMVPLWLTHSTLFTASCLPYVPEKGTVGASGDLAPLSHLAVGLMGEGMMWSPKSGWADAKLVNPDNYNNYNNNNCWGLSLINGTQMITSLGAEAVERAQAITRQADVIAALTLEVLKGKAHDSNMDAARPHPGQKEAAWRFHSVLHSDVFPSELSGKYSASVMNCSFMTRINSFVAAFQVHGMVNDTIAFVKNIISTEMNSVTDNPLVLAERGDVISAGNFHGEYPAKALDYLSIAMYEVASFSERRIGHLCDPSLSGLPASLVSKSGLNSGFSMAHRTAATLVLESRALCHPSSVDSLSTSAATEDHVSMGGWAARKALRVVEHVEQVLAIELLAACQGLEFRRPLKTTAPLEKVYQLLRSVVRPWDQDRVMSADIEAAHRLLLEEQVWEAVCPLLEQHEASHCPAEEQAGGVESLKKMPSHC